ncbi:MAG: putative toxin-antitoxin system toxin component, PIN family [Acidobacteriota bacterium]
MTAELLRVVFDCNILWQAFFSKTGASGRCQKLVEDGKIILFLSADVLDEVRDVLTRPETQNQFAQATPEAVEAFLKDLTSKAVVLKSVAQKFRYERDPKDEPYINLAVETKADYLVSRDKDLLDLMTGHTAECKEFRQRFRPLKIIDPVAFLKLFTDPD